MAHLPLRLKRRRRRDLSELLVRLDLLSLYLGAGFDLSYAWGEATGSAPGPVAGELDRLARTYPNPVHRVWFASLRDLYGQGAPVQPLVAAFADYLRKERARDMEVFARELPTRANLLLLLFFLPAAFLLLFAPLLLQLGQAFSP